MALHNYSPWCGTVNIPTSGTAVDLQTLVQATTNPPIEGTSFQGMFSYVQVQFPTTESGLLYVGNSDVSATNRGVEMVPGQSWAPPSLTSNSYMLPQIFLVSDHNNAKVNVTLCRAH